MKKIFTILGASLLSTSLYAQVVINEIDFLSSQIELKNNGTQQVDVTNYFFCNFPSYEGIVNLTATSGSKIIQPGGFLVLSTSIASSPFGGELGLYSSGASYGASENIVDYIEWGESDHKRSPVGVAAGVWTQGAFIPALALGESIEYDGEGDTGSDYDAVTTGSMGSENSAVTSIDDKVEVLFTVFPNPTTEVLNFNTIVESAKVYNELGEIELDVTLTDKVDVSTLENGSYIVETITNGVRSTSKFVKQ